MTRDPLLALEDLTKRFGSLTAVDGLTLSIPAGEHHALIGPNGAGKTTAFDLITGAQPPTEGRVYFEGEDVTHRREDERARRGIVRSFQLTKLFLALSIRENLRLAIQATDQTFNPLGTLDPAGVNRADQLLTALDIDADPTTEASALSHGDRKRLEIGTALAADPTLLLLDEPTSGVADDAAASLMGFVAEATAETTVILIEHDVSTALEFADRVTVMDRGSVVATGTPEAIAADGRVQETYLGGAYGSAPDR